MLIKLRGGVPPLAIARYRNIIPSIVIITLIILMIGYMLYVNVSELQVKGEIKIESLTPIPENRTIIAVVRNVGNVTVSSEKAYITLPSGATIIGLIPYIEIKPGEVKILSIDVSEYLFLALTEPGVYVVELRFSHGAVDKASFNIP
ncbi:hypothetical protein DRN86_05795 [Candidatus Geothermarchaeota archaeon]|nr:MAG: hypothetical protein DRN86_05795 [Candidatus Geothermarchaeota archaeon]